MYLVKNRANMHGNCMHRGRRASASKRANNVGKRAPENRQEQRKSTRGVEGVGVSVVTENNPLELPRAAKN